MDTVYIVLIIIGALLVALMALAYVLFNYACVRKKRSSTVDLVDSSFDSLMATINAGAQWMEDTPHDSVTLMSFDGLKLCARVYTASGSKRTVVCMHGYRSRGMFDYSVHTEEYVKRGYNVVVPDQRACGDSEGRYITYGVRERRDCLMWINYAEERFGGSIYLHGLSLGCATVLMTLGLDLPKSVKGVIADCGYYSPWSECRHVMKSSMHLPPFPLLWLANVYCRVFAGFGLKQCDTREILKNNHVPVLFIHGQRDNFVPTYMTDENYAANAGEKYYFRAEKSTHATSYYDEPENFRKQQFEFLSKH